MAEETNYLLPILVVVIPIVLAALIKAINFFGKRWLAKRDKTGAGNVLHHTNGQIWGNLFSKAERLINETEDFETIIFLHAQTPKGHDSRIRVVNFDDVSSDLQKQRDDFLRKYDHPGTFPADAFYEDLLLRLDKKPVVFLSTKAMKEAGDIGTLLSFYEQEGFFHSALGLIRKFESVVTIDEKEVATTERDYIAIGRRQTESYSAKAKREIVAFIEMARKKLK